MKLSHETPHRGIFAPLPLMSTHPVPHELAKRLKVEIRVIQVEPGVKGLRGEGVKG
jgi:hypothetical protein